MGDGHGARWAGADDPPGCHQGSVADPDREDECEHREFSIDYPVLRDLSLRLNCEQWLGEYRK